MRVYGIDKDNLDIKDIVRLANHFVVPYHTMVRRLNEIDILTDRKYQEYAAYTEKQTEIWRNRLGLTLPMRGSNISLSNLVDMAMGLYEKKLITYEKLEYLLEFAELTPADMEVMGPVEYRQPTDEELDAIMEE